MVSMGASEYCMPEMEKHFVHNSLFAGATSRKAIHDGRAYFTVSHFSQIPQAVHRKDPARRCDIVHGLPTGRARVLLLRRIRRLHKTRCGKLEARHRRGDAEHAQNARRCVHPCLGHRLHRGVRLQAHHPAAAQVNGKRQEDRRTHRRAHPGRRYPAARHRFRTGRHPGVPEA